MQARLHIFLLLGLGTVLFSTGCIKKKSPLGNGEGIWGRREVASYDNARIRCDFRKQAANEFKVTCVTVAFDEYGEFLARAIDPSTSLTWSDPRQIFGRDVSELSCSIAGDNLSQECFVRTQDSSRVDVKHSIQLTLVESGQSRTEDTVVVLPFSVSVLGKVHSLPAYQSRGQSDANTDSNEPGVSVGLQTPDIDPLEKNSLSFSNPKMCNAPLSTYLASNENIYRLRNGKLTLFAGSSRLGTKGDLTHRLRLHLSNFNIGHACDDNGIHLINDQKLYYVPEKGPVKMVRDLTSLDVGSSLLPPPQLWARGPDGSLYYTAGAIFKRLKPDGEELFVNPAFGLDIQDVRVLSDNRLFILDKTAKQVVIINAEQTSRSVLVDATDLSALNTLSLPTARGALAVSPQGDMHLMISSGVPTGVSIYKLSLRAAQEVFSRPSLGARAPYCRPYQASETTGHAFENHDFMDPRAFDITSSGKLLVWDWFDCRLLEVDKVGKVVPKMVSIFLPGTMVFEPTSVDKLEMPGISGLATLGNGKVYFSTSKSSGLHGVNIGSNALQNLILPDGGLELHSVPSGNVYAVTPHYFGRTTPRVVYKIAQDGGISEAWTIPAEISTWSTMSFVSDDVAFYATMDNSINGLAVFYSRIYRVDLQTKQYTKIAGVFPMDDPALPVFASPVAAQDTVLSISQISAGQDGALYLLSGRQNMIHRIFPANENAQIVTVVGSGVNSPTEGSPAHTVNPGQLNAVAVDSIGRLYVSESGVGLRLLKIVDFRFETIPIFMMTTAVPQTLLGRDCTGGSTSPIFASTEGQLNQVISSFCVSQPGKIAVSDSCQGNQGKSFLAFSQNFDGLNNIFFIERPCGQ